MDDNIPASSSSPTEANSKASNHVAVSVPDLDKAVKWYHEVLEYYRPSDLSDLSDIVRQLIINIVNLTKELIYSICCSWLLHL